MSDLHDEIVAIVYKHLPGKHNQKRHGIRSGGASFQKYVSSRADRMRQGDDWELPKKELYKKAREGAVHDLLDGYSDLREAIEAVQLNRKRGRRDMGYTPEGFPMTTELMTAAIGYAKKNNIPIGYRRNK